MKENHKYVIGVDEVGRGPLAGPVAVGMACVPAKFDWMQLPGVTDSKKLTEAKREEIFTLARQLKAAGRLHYEVSMVSAKVIDRIGIVPAISLAMERALRRVETNARRPNLFFKEKVWPADCVVKLDGGLLAPARYQEQETIVKGDSKEQTIGLASIMAKVTRDRYMRRLALRAAYTPYNFAQHKGYGTQAHREAIDIYGLSNQHRRSFCKGYASR